MIIIRTSVHKKPQISIANYQEGVELTEKEVLDLFNLIKGDDAAGEYYVGITCDPDRREKEHNATFLAVVDCFSMEKAQTLEKAAANMGFDAGETPGNVHEPESKKIYIYKKNENTIE